MVDYNKGAVVLFRTVYDGDTESVARVPPVTAPEPGLGLATRGISSPQTNSFFIESSVVELASCLASSSRTLPHPLGYKPTPSLLQVHGVSRCCLGRR